MGKKKRFNEDEVGKGLQYIRNLPLKAGKTQAEVAAIYAPSIRGAMKRGYSLEEIQEGLAKTVGVSIQMTKLKAAVDALGDDNAPGVTVKPEKKTAKKKPEKDTCPQPEQKDEDNTVEQSAKMTDGQKDVGMPESRTGTAAPKPELKETEKTPGAPDPEGTPQNDDLGTGKTEGEAAPLTADKDPATPSLAGMPVLHKERINLSCRKEDQELAKRLGALWDSDKKLCYIPPQTDLRPFEKLLPKPLASYGTHT